MSQINPDRVRRMLRSERRRRGSDSSYYGPHTPTYRVAQRFGITCEHVRQIVRKGRHASEA